MRIDLAARFVSPEWASPFGTDQFGRDIFARVAAAILTSGAIAASSVTIALAIGIPIGISSAFFGGVFDRAMTALTDALFAFPGVLLALIIIAAVGPSQTGVVIALSGAQLPTVIRVARSAGLSVISEDYVAASAVAGHPRWYTMTKHVAPNCMGAVLAVSSSLLAGAILSESALNFLGLGVPPPAPTLGGMLADAREYLATAIWMAIAPGVVLVLLLLSVNLLGDALRDRADPRMSVAR